MKRPIALLLLLLVSVLAGCAASHSTSSPAPAASVRCLSDPNERGTRPLIFLFCIQSP